MSEEKKGKTKEVGSIICSNILCSIRAKTLLTLLVAFVVFYCVILGLVLGVFPNTFLEFEKNNLNQASRRVNRVLKDQADDLAKFTQQYFAAWDTTYDTLNNYLSTRDFAPVQTYLDENFADAIFTTYRLDFVGFYFLNGTMTVSRTYDFATSTLNGITMPSELSSFPQLFKNVDFSNPQTKAQGFVTPSDRNITYLIVAVPVQKTSFQGPVNFITISGRQLNTRTISDMALRSQLCVTQFFGNNRYNWESLYNNGLADTNGLKPNYRSSLITPNISSIIWQDVDLSYITPFKKESNMTTTLLGRACWASSQPDDQISANLSSVTIPKDRYSGYNFYADITGKFSLGIRIDMNRSVTSLSDFATLTVLLILLGVGLGFFILIEVLLECLVLCRMTRLTLQIKKIRENPDPETQSLVNTTGGLDEIGYLSQNINDMLTNIKESEKQLTSFVNRLGQEEEKARVMLDALPDSIIIFDPSNGKISKVNSTFEKIFAPFNEIKEKTIYQILTDIKADDLNNADVNGVESNIPSKFIKIPAQVTTTKIDFFVADKKVPHVMAILRDMREKKDAQDKLEKEKKALAELEKQMEFEEQFRDPIVREALRLFCEKEKTVENVLLLIEIETYKKLDQTKRARAQKIIYDKYLKQGAEFQVNISKKSLDEAIQKVENGVGQIDLFNNLEKAIKFNLVGESFSRFQSVKNDMIEQVLKDMEEEQKNPKKGSMKKPITFVGQGSTMINQDATNFLKVTGKE